MNILVLYGLPGTGKSSVISNFKKYLPISVDVLIRKEKQNPSISDFEMLSNTLIFQVIKFIENNPCSDIVIEMGCLMPIKSIFLLEDFLRRKNLSYLNVVLITDKDELINRLNKRNTDISLGLSNAIKIDFPINIIKFIEKFSFNQPSNFLTIDTTNKDIDLIVSEILFKIDSVL